MRRFSPALLGLFDMLSTQSLMPRAVPILKTSVADAVDGHDVTSAIGTAGATRLQTWWSGHWHGVGCSACVKETEMSGIELDAPARDREIAAACACRRWPTRPDGYFEEPPTAAIANRG